MIRPIRHIGRMAPYALADVGGAGVTSLAQNESAFDPSPAALEAGVGAGTAALLYPDPDWADLRAAIAEVHKINPDLILCGAGSMELIGCLIRAFAGPGDQVLGTEFGYAFVATAAAQVQAEYLRVAEVDLTVSVENILRAVTPETRIVFLCNPGNPTGTRISNKEILDLRDQLPAQVLLIVDQAYGEFSDNLEHPVEIFDLVNRGNTVVLRTFSKAYALAGARVGWGYFPDPIATEVRKLLNPNNISGVSQAMATAAMSDQRHMKNIVARTSKILEGFSQSARDLGLTVPHSHTNFALLRFRSAEQAEQADAELRRAGLMLRGMGGYGLPDCLRATVCAQPVMDRVLSVLKDEIT